MVPSAGAGDVQQVPFGIIDFLEVGIFTHRLDTLLQRNDLVVASQKRLREARRPPIIDFTQP
jgi:hypothetical protein